MPENNINQPQTYDGVKPQLRTVDLNLLTVFDAVMQEQNITRAAQSLGMSQPAVSNAVARLGNDSNLLIVFYVQIMPDDFVMQLHRF